MLPCAAIEQHDYQQIRQGKGDVAVNFLVEGGALRR